MLYAYFNLPGRSTVQEARLHVTVQKENSCYLMRLKKRGKDARVIE